jgi:hypothetical protein
MVQGFIFEDDLQFSKNFMKTIRKGTHHTAYAAENENFEFSRSVRQKSEEEGNLKLNPVIMFCQNLLQKFREKLHRYDGGAGGGDMQCML